MDKKEVFAIGMWDRVWNDKAKVYKILFATYAEAESKYTELCILFPEEEFKIIPVMIDHDAPMLAHGVGSPQTNIRPDMTFRVNPGYSLEAEDDARKSQYGH